MNRIIEALTKEYCKMTAIDGLIVGVIILSIFFGLYFLWGMIEEATK